MRKSVSIISRKIDFFEKRRHILHVSTLTTTVATNSINALAFNFGPTTFFLMLAKEFGGLNLQLTLEYSELH